MMFFVFHISQLLSHFLISVTLELHIWQNLTTNCEEDLSVQWGGQLCLGILWMWFTLFRGVMGKILWSRDKYFIMQSTFLWEKMISEVWNSYTFHTWWGPSPCPSQCPWGPSTWNILYDSYLLHLSTQFPKAFSA